MTIEPWNAQFVSETAEADPRRHARQNVIHQVRIGKSGIAYPAVLMDVSVDGVSFTSFGPFKKGAGIQIDLGEGKMHDGYVCWDNGVRTGCVFVQPITEEIVRRLAGRC